MVFLRQSEDVTNGGFVWRGGSRMAAVPLTIRGFVFRRGLALVLGNRMVAEVVFFVGDGADLALALPLFFLEGASDPPDGTQFRPVPPL